jgi:hypothetical protein
MPMETLLSKLKGAEHELYPVAQPSDIRRTEDALGRPLPPSYAAFVSTFSNGAYLYLLQEVGAVGDGNQQIAAIQSIDLEDWPEADDTIAFHEGGSLKGSALIPFGLDHNGNAWCFLAEQGAAAEYPVAYFVPLKRKLYGRLDSFTQWLGILIEKQEEVIRTLYDEDMVFDELELG